MRTFIRTKLSLMVAVAALSLVSCLKSDLPSATNYYDRPSMLVEAYITDLGPVNDTTWNTQVLIRGLKYVLTNEYGTFLQSGSLLQVGFFTGKDGSIPSGEYTFSDATGKIPFTFSNAFLSIGGSFIGINSGSVAVSSVGASYSFIFKCGLSDGATFTADYTGPVLSADQY